MLDDVRRTVDQMRQIQTAILDQYLEAFKRIQPAITDLLGPILARIKRARAEHLETTMRRYRWWPVPGLLWEFYEGILELEDQGRTRYVNRYICDWFGWNRCRRLGRLARRWSANEYFRRRHEESLTRAEATIRRLSHANEPITFQIIARAAESRCPGSTSILRLRSAFNV